MINKRVVLFCIVLAVLAVTLQAVPGIPGSAFAFAVIPGGLPIYIAARLNCILGLVIFFSVAVLSACMNMSEAMFFICVSGIIGLTLGIMKDRLKYIYLIPIPSVLTVFVMLSVVNYSFGISIFSNTYQRTLAQQALALVPTLYIYCFIYLKLFLLAENLFHRNIDLS